MPYAINDIDITQPLPTLVVAEGDTGIALIVRRTGRPIGFVMKELPAESILAPEDLLRLIGDHVHPQLLETSELPELTSPGFSAVLPSLTVAICTKDNS